MSEIHADHTIDHARLHELYEEFTRHDLFNRPSLEVIKKQLTYYRCTQYDADVAAALAEARYWVEARAPQVAKPAIVLDIDETALSNWKRIFKDHFEYFKYGRCRLDNRDEACGELAWERREQATAIQPTLDLYKFARCYGVALPCKTVEVFFITGRNKHDLKIDGKTPTEWTCENLIKAGYSGLSRDHLLMNYGPVNSKGSVAPFKRAARIEIEEHFKVTIIANVGDQNSDLDGGHAERTFKVPNPFYFIP
jgi:acid phosphatase